MPKGKPIEPLDLEELESNPSLNGMLDFRESPITSAASIANTDRTPIGRAPIGPASVQRPISAKISHSTSAAIATGGFAPTGLVPIGSDVTRDVISGPVLADVLAELADLPRPPKSRGKTLRAARVEDGHSATQDALYWYLWRSGKHVNGSRSRFVQAGYGQIQAGLGIDRSNVQDAIRELQKKLSIRILKASTVGSATVYEVFSCEDILAKRKSEGLVWVRKFGTRRADLLTSPEDESAAPIGLAPTGLTDGGGVTPTGSVGLAPTEGVGLTPIQLVRQQANSKTQTSTALAIVIRSIQEELGVADDSAAKRILQSCYQQAPDATDEELEFHVRQQACRVRKSKRVENPLGLLIAQIPKCFEGESFRQFRDVRRQQEEQGREARLAEEARRQEEAAQLRAKLGDPDTSEEEKSLIRRILG